MKTVIALLLFIAVAPPVWLTDFEEAKMQAQKENKYILLNFSGSDWCGPCIRLKKEVFESDAFSPVAENSLVLVRADFPRAKKNRLSEEQTQHNEALAGKYNPDGNFPFTLLLNADGRVVKTWNGYQPGTQDKFMAELRQQLAAPGNP